jgi:SAM-dependent methyltransferase
MPGREDWMAAADAADTEEIRERILTGYRDGKPFTPYVPTLTLPPGLSRVLDFGCGLGRNFPYLTQIAGAVTGFDLPPMIDRCRAAAAVPVARLTSDWDALRTEQFDLIFASLVLQHIEPGPMRAFLADFARMAPAVYLLTRTRTDFEESMLDVIAAIDLFDASECVEVDHDSVTHQLRVLDRIPFDRARAIQNERHFELLLTSGR